MTRPTQGKLWRSGVASLSYIYTYVVVVVAVGEMYRKDYIDVSNQEHTAPVYFQSLSLDFRLSVDGVFWMLFCERIENINISLG